MYSLTGRPVHLRATRALVLAVLISLVTAVLLSLPAPAAALPLLA